MPCTIWIEERQEHRDAGVKRAHARSCERQIDTKACTTSWPEIDTTAISRSFGEISCKLLGNLNSCKVCFTEKWGFSGLVTFLIDEGVGPHPNAMRALLRCCAAPDATRAADGWTALHLPLRSRRRLRGRVRARAARGRRQAGAGRDGQAARRVRGHPRASARRRRTATRLKSRNPYFSAGPWPHVKVSSTLSCGNQ